MHVSAILKTKGSTVHWLPADATLAAAAVELTARHIGALVVSTDGQTISGIISERDIIRALSQTGVEAFEHTCAKYMTREVVTCNVGDTLATIMAIMTERRIRHLPVVEDGTLQGIITIGDVVKRRLDEVEEEAETMRNMIAGG